MRKFCAILCTVALTVGMTTSAFAEEAVNESPSDVNASTVVAVDLEAEVTKTAEAVSSAVTSGALDESEYTVNEDGTVTLQLTSTDGSTVEIAAEDAILVLKSVAKEAIADKYTTHADVLAEELAAAEAAGDETKVAEIKNAITINTATAAVMTAIANGDQEPWTTLEEYVELILAAAAEVDAETDASLNIVEVDKETGEVKEPEVALSDLESVTTETFEVAYTDKNNLIDNGDGTYDVDDYETYIAKNGKASEHVEEASDEETTSGDALIYQPTSINVSETLKDFDWENNTLYFALQDVNNTVYLITITENMLDGDILTFNVPATGSGTFYSVPIPEEETETEVAE